MIKVCSHSQRLTCNCKEMRKLGIYINEDTRNLYYSHNAFDSAQNRVLPERVWIDEDGLICVKMKVPYIYPNAKKGNIK